MATESDLRDLLQGPDPEGRAAIDLDAVLSRARRRRRPKVVVAQALGSVAAVGVLVTGVAVALPPVAPASLTVAEDSTGGAEEFASTPQDADESTLRPEVSCGAPATTPPLVEGLALDVTSIEAEVGMGEIGVTVTLRNESAERIVGTAAVEPRMTLYRDGVVTWHAFGAMDSAGRTVDLAPGESLDFIGRFDTAVCSPEDEVAGFTEDLPDAPAGDYLLGATLAVVLEDGTSLVVAGPPAPVTLR